jgi:hypothetical protein
MVNATVTICAGETRVLAGKVLGAAAAAAALVCALPAPASAQSKTQVAKASVKIVKPLVLSWRQDLSLGDILIPAAGVWPSSTVSLTRTGAFTCPAPLTCSGLRQVAQYRVAGSNNQAVRIGAPSVILTNQGDPTKSLTMTVDSPATVSIPNSGQQGTIFSLGGAITLTPATAQGVYAGTFNVTVDYQ